MKFEEFESKTENLEKCLGYLVHQVMEKHKKINPEIQGNAIIGALLELYSKSVQIAFSQPIFEDLTGEKYKTEKEYKRALKEFAGDNLRRNCMEIHARKVLNNEIGN